MLPDPLDLTSCYSHCRYTRWFYHIKQAFLKEATDLLSPDSYVSRDMVSSEQHQLYDWAESEDQVAEAFRVEPKLRSMTLVQEKETTDQVIPHMRVMDNGRRFGLNYSLRMPNSKTRFYYIGEERVSCMFLGRSL
jgi:hypothetical protein